MAVTLKHKLAPAWYKIEGFEAEFNLRPLTELEMIDVYNETNISGRGRSTRILLSSAGIRNSLMLSLNDWRDVVDEKGEQLKFNRDAIPDLDAILLRGLAQKVIEISTLSEAEKKT